MVSVNRRVWEGVCPDRAGCGRQNVMKQQTKNNMLRVNMIPTISYWLRHIHDAPPLPFFSLPMRSILPIIYLTVPDGPVIAVVCGAMSFECMSDTREEHT
jgi:hypothetical protein